MLPQADCSGWGLVGRSQGAHCVAFQEPRVLAQALVLLGAEGSRKIAIDYGIDSERARLLPAGLLILGQVAELFKAPLVVGHGGIREGVLLEASSK